MSGKPSIEGVTQFRMALQRFTHAEAQVQQLSQQMLGLEKQLNGQQHEYRTAERLMFKAMEDMDVAASGNSGYEARAGWFFAELYRQVHDSLKAPELQ